MARKTARPGRTLIIFFLVVAALYAGVAASGVVEAQAGARPPGRHPDHPAGQPANGQRPTPAKLQEARGIIDQRVNGSGVAESEVAPRAAATSSWRSPARSAMTWSTRSSRPRSCASGWSPCRPRQRRSRRHSGQPDGSGSVGPPSGSRPAAQASRAPAPAGPRPSRRPASGRRQAEAPARPAPSARPPRPRPSRGAHRCARRSDPRR